MLLPTACHKCVVLHTMLCCTQCCVDSSSATQLILNAFIQHCLQTAIDRCKEPPQLSFDPSLLALQCIRTRSHRWTVRHYCARHYFKLTRHWTRCPTSRPTQQHPEQDTILAQWSSLRLTQACTQQHNSHCQVTKWPALAPRLIPFSVSFLAACHIMS